MAKTTGKDSKKADEKPVKKQGSGYLNISEVTAKEAAPNAFSEWQKAKELAETKKEAWEDAFIKEARNRGSLEDGKTLKFSHRYGIAAEIVDDDGSGRGGKKEFKL